MPVKIEYIKQTDDNILKITKTDSGSEFEFLGKQYSIEILQNATLIKNYSEDVVLLKDRFNCLFVYACREEMRFDSDLDRVDMVWSFVESIEDADKLVKVIDPIWGRVPYIYKSETGYVCIKEKTNAKNWFYIIYHGIQQCFCTK